MAYETSWYLAGRVVYVYVHGDFSLEELEALSQEFVTHYVPEGQPPVHTMIDMREVGAYATRLDKVKAASDAAMTHPDMGWMIIVGKPNPLLKFVTSVTSQVSGTRFRMVHTPEDAIASLRKLDLTLHDLPDWVATEFS